MRPVAAAVLLSLLATRADAGSFRNNGTGAYDATPPTRFHAVADALWSATPPSWSNSSPVLFAGLVCTLAEPTTVWCVDAATGRPKWSATNDFADTLTAAERPAFDLKVADAARAATDVAALQARFGELRKALRSKPGDAALSSELDALSGKLASARALVDGFSPFVAGSDREVIGYTTHTPVADAAHLFVQTGNGVVSSFDASGKRLWSKWLGPAPRPPRGYALGTAASPQLVDGMLIVAQGNLFALDPATGRERWRSVPYKDFGTPGVAHVGSTTVLLTPAGELVRASDGVVLSKGLGDVWYVGPTVIGQDVYYVGGRSDVHISAGAKPAATSWHLTEAAPGDVRATKRWTSDIPATEPFYTAGVVLPGALMVADRGTRLWRIDTTTGAVAAASSPLDGIVFGPSYSSPLFAGGRVWVWSETGTSASFAPGGGPAETWRWETMRSTPVFDHDRLYVRTLDHLLCFGGAR